MPRRTSPLLAIAATLAVAAIAALSPGAFALAQAQVGAPDVRVEVGKSVVVSPGPISRLICDDPIVEPVATDSGMTFRGLKPGRTTCSFTNAVPVRVIMSVEVVPASGGAGTPRN